MIAGRVGILLLGHPYALLFYRNLSVMWLLPWLLLQHHLVILRLINLMAIVRLCDGSLAVAALVVGVATVVEIVFATIITTTIIQTIKSICSSNNSNFNVNVLAQDVKVFIAIIIAKGGDPRVSITLQPLML